MKENLYQTVRERILYLEYKPGQILNEKVLAEEFKVSRSPVKDVLNRLEWDQFVRVIPRTGSMVTEIEFHKIMNVYQVRFEIESFEAALAENQFSPAHFQELNALYASAGDLMETVDPKALTKVDAAVRTLIHDAAGNPVLAEVSDRLYSQTFRLWYSVLTRSDWHEEVSAVRKELKKVIDAFSSDNPSGVGALRRTQLMNHFERLRSKFLG